MFNREDKRSYKNMTLAEAIMLSEAGFALLLEDGEVKDIVKEGINKTIEKLKKQNIEVVMITGDNEKTAKKVASQIGIEKVIANVTPKEKAEEIKKLKQDGLVMMWEME